MRQRNSMQTICRRHQHGFIGELHQCTVCAAAPRLERSDSLASDAPAADAPWVEDGCEICFALHVVRLHGIDTSMYSATRQARTQRAPQTQRRGR